MGDSTAAIAAAAAVALTCLLAVVVFRTSLGPWYHSSLGVQPSSAIHSVSSYMHRRVYHDVVAGVTACSKDLLHGDRAAYATVTSWLFLVFFELCTGVCLHVCVFQCLYVLREWSAPAQLKCWCQVKRVVSMVLQVCALRHCRSLVFV